MDDSSRPDPGGSAAPIFILGSMRSGSTLLRLILDSHENIAIGPETGFMGAVAATKAIPGWTAGRDWYRRLDWTEGEIDDRLREFYGGMFRRYAGSQGARRWGDKTPFHLGHAAQMAQVFPDAVFVGIVRHPGAVAVSLGKKFHYTFHDAVSYWSATNLDLVRAAGSLGHRLSLLRYEDLVLDAEPVIRELLDWLGEPWSPALLEHDRVHREKGTPRAADGSTSTRDPIDAKRATSWARGLRSDNERSLAGVAELAAFFGYDPLSGDEREPLPSVAGRRWLTDGADLRGRCEQWADRINFDARRAAPAVDADPIELAVRLERVEQTLARVRSRRVVRIGDAIRTVQHGRSVKDVRKAYSRLRGRR